MSTAVTGIRPTGELTVANYAGAIRPMTELQDTYDGDIFAFVADLHGLTDQPPSVIKEARYPVVRTFMAGGVDPERINLYVQRDIGEPLLRIREYLAPIITLNRVTRIPTVKEKLTQAGENEEDVGAANLGLANYPVLMAADIFAQMANHVPVGKDQNPHLEITRELAKRFNGLFPHADGEDTLVVPQGLEEEGVNIVSLAGNGKMSKSDANGAILLNEDPASATKKIRRAITGNAGEESPRLENYMLLCERLGATEDQLIELRKLYDAHLVGSAVMGQFKDAMIEVVVPFLKGFQDRYKNITDAEVHAAVERGGEMAMQNAKHVANRMEQAMDFI